jgi:hypothetical protein
VFLLRPAATQIIFKNWVGSMGAPAAVFSHIVGDSVVSPPDHAFLFTERVMMHPLSFFAPASYTAHHSPSAAFQQFISACAGDAEARDGMGQAAAPLFDFGVLKQQLLLPSSWEQERRVICNFNVPFKSSSSDTAAWGRVLAEGKGSLGFITVAHPDLLDGTQALLSSIVSACTERLSNISYSSSHSNTCLVHILPHLSQSDHTAIKALLCDVTADSTNYNGHSTVAEMLYLGLPCVTQPGLSMASRVAASLLLLGSRVSAGVVMPGDYEQVLAELARGNAAAERSSRCLAAARRHRSVAGLGRSTRAWVSAMDQWVLRWEQRLRMVAELPLQAMHVI